MSSTKIGSAFVDLKVRDNKFMKGIAAAGAAVAAFGALSLRALAKQEEAEAKLEQVIRATGAAAGFTAEELKKEAAALQSVTKFGDEAIMETQALMATFREIKGGEFKEATSLALDMATLFGDARSATIQIGKALNDPIKGITALTRVGITFTDEQKKQIRNFQEQGNIAKAQGVILKELQNQFGGVAAAAADTIGGRFAQLKNSLGDTMEGFGRLFAGGDADNFADFLLKIRLRVDEFNEGLKIMAERFKPVTDGVKKFFAAFSRAGNLTTGVFMNLMEGKGFIESFKQAGAAADIIEQRRAQSFAEAKATSEAAKNKAALAAGVIPEAAGMATGAAKQAKAGFTSFQGAIKKTQNEQQKKDNMKIIKNGTDQLKVQKEMLTELEEMNTGGPGRQPIVTE